MTRLAVFVMLVVVFIGIKLNTIAQSQGELEVISLENIDRIEQLVTLEASQLETVTDAIISPNSSMIVLRDRSGSREIELWDLQPLGLRHILIPERESIIWNLEFSYDENALAIQQDDFIQVWDTETGDTRFTIEEDIHINIMHFAPQMDSLGYVLVPDDESSDKEAVYIWNINQRQEVAVLPHPTVRIFAFSEDSRYLVSGGTDGSIRLWERGENTFAQEFELIREGDSRAVWDIGFVADSAIYFTVGKDTPETLHIWDYQLSEPVESDYEFGFPISSNVFASRLSDDTFQLWNITDGSKLALLSLRSLHVTGTPDQHVFATTGSNTVDFFNAVNGEILKTFICEPRCFTSFSPDGLYFSTWGIGNTVSLWGIPSGE